MVKRLSLAIRFFGEHTLIFSVFLTCLYIIFILPITESVAFASDGIPIVRIGLRVGFSVLMTIGIYYLIGFLKNLKRGSKRHKNWVLASFVTMLYFLIFLVLTWPGYWSWDEFHILDGLREGSYPRWQGVLTAVLFTFYLYLFPSGAFFVLFQVIAVSVVAGYAFSVISEILPAKRWLGWIVLVPLLMPASIVMVMYPLRITIYTSILLAVIFRLMRVFIVENVQARPLIEFLGMSVAACVLATWRSEGIIFFVLIPILCWRYGLLSKKVNFRKRLLAGGLGAGLMLGSFGASYLTTPSRYAVTAIVNPLSVMLQDSRNWEYDDPDLKALGKIVNLNLIAKNPSSSEIPAFWSSEWQTEDVGAASFMVPYLRYVLRHPSAFLDARFATFLATNRLPAKYADPSLHALVQNPYIFDPQKYSPPHPIYDFEENNMFGSSLSWEVRKATILNLLAIEKGGSDMQGGFLLWNVIAGLAMTLLCFLISLLRKQRLFLLLSATLIAYAIMIFLFAPAAYYMYYFPVILTGSVLCLFQIAQMSGDTIKKPSSSRDKIKSLGEQN